MKNGTRYKLYPRYKHSGVDWLGDIPETWSIIRLRYAARVNPAKSKVENLDVVDDVSFVPMESIGEDGTITLGQSKPLESVYQGYTYFRDGDIIIAKITPCFENGKGALAKNLVNGVGFGTTELHVLRARDIIDRKFLFYLTRSVAFREPGEASMYGAGGQKRVPDDFVLNFKTAFPSAPEQRAIAEFLDREVAKIDELIAKKELLIELLEEKRVALITHAVTRGLNPDAPLRDSGIEWLGEIPAHWEVRRLKFAARATTGFAFSSADFVNEGIPLLRIGDITFDGRIDLSHAKYLPADFLKTYADVMVHGGDIVMAMTGATIGKAGRHQGKVPALLNQRVCMFHAGSGTAPSYLWYLLNAQFYSDHVLLIAFGGAQPNISDAELLDCRVPRPPVHEQAEIVNYVEAQLTKIWAMRSKVEEAIITLHEYRGALITAAVTGKINLRDEAVAAA